MDSVENKIVVFDFDIPQLLNNKIFDPKEAFKVSHTILPNCYLYQQAKQQGIELMTADVFLNLADKPKSALLMTHLTTPFTQRLIAAGAKPTILTCQESPFVATRFYLGLKKYSSQFKYSWVFSGMQKRLSPKTQYLQMYFPMVFNPADFKPLPFEQKGYLTTITGNKRIGNWKKDILIKLMYGFNIREVYSLRQEIINFYAEKGTFDLYGTGWGAGGRTPLETANIKKVYRGSVARKWPVLSRYKFTFCLENSVFPGYVTDKIFDAMFAGSVPVYVGAPDAADMIPKNTFINMANFKSLEELDLFLSSINEADYEKYLKNIWEYLNSDGYRKFSYQTFNNQVLDIFQKEFPIN